MKSNFVCTKLLFCVIVLKKFKMKKIYQLIPFVALLVLISPSHTSAQIVYPDSVKSFIIVKNTPMNNKTWKEDGYSYYFFSKMPTINEALDTRIFYVGFEDSLVSETTSDKLLKYTASNGIRLLLLPLVHDKNSLSSYNVQLYLQQRCEFDKVSSSLAISEMITAYKQVLKEGNPEKDWTQLLDFDIGKKK